MNNVPPKFGRIESFAPTLLRHGTPPVATGVPTQPASSTANPAPPVFAWLAQKNAGLRRKNAGLEAKIAGLGRKIAGLEAKIAGLENKIAGLENKIAGLDTKKRAM